MHLKRLIISSVISASALLASAGSADALWNKFANPSDEARTKVWWFHGETVTTEAGIDADLEAFKAAGVGGVVYYDQVHYSAEGAFDAMSPQWWHMLRYAARKAKELGLTFEVAASNGYVAGGPWITPELAMQQTAFTDTLLTVGADSTVSVTLPASHRHFTDIATIAFPDSPDMQAITIMPGRRELHDNESATITYDCRQPVSISAVTYSVSPRGKGSTGSMNIPGKPQERYFGAKYIEFPPIGELEYSIDGTSWHTAASLQGIESVIGHKSRERTISFPAVHGRYFRISLHDWQGDDKKLNKLWIENIRLSPRDLTDNWQVQAGLRTEVTYPKPVGGNHGAIASAHVRNLTAGIDNLGHLRATLAPGTWRIIRFGHQPTGARTKHGRRNLLGPEADVMSAKAATVHYQHYFKAIYDSLATIGVRPHGMCMDSHEAGIQNWTHGFENRFMAENGYDITPWLPALAGYIVDSRDSTERMLLDFRKTIARTIASEFYGTLDQLCRADGVDFTSQAMLNIDNDNIMSRGMVSKPQGEFWAYQTNGNYDCLDAASSAHLYGRPIASGEAFTDTPYSRTWDELLRIANLAYCRGINEFVVCASSYQPYLDRKYDDDQSAHPYIFHRLNPNWNTSPAFWNYQARCSQLLRMGRPVVDLCVYLGENLPGKTMAYKLPDIPEGYNFDVCTYDALMNRMKARGGVIEVDGGMQYKALLVQDRSILSPDALAAIEALEQAGVPVVWCNKGENPASRLAAAGIAPDMALTSANLPDDKTYFAHRVTDSADIYFVYNHSDHDYTSQVTLRTARTDIEQWNPYTLQRYKPESSGSKVSLHLRPYEAAFLIAR